jgi:NAD(P)-dependent dehydrogenase (short-subunit alcohol dehydrogenase family)
MTDLSGLVAVVTGGNDGIGYGIAEALARAGADIAVWGRRAERNETAATGLAALGVGTTAATCDVSDRVQVDAAMAHTLDALGKVDILVANAGRGGSGASVLDVDLEEWRAVTAVNLDGAFLCLQAAARHMVERGEGGSLITIASTSAFHGAPHNAAYGASKAGVLALTRSMAVGLARHRIRVNALCPGWTRTELSELGYQNEAFRNVTVRRTPARRWADPSEMGPAAVYLADPEPTFHTGDHLVVDGGYTIF